MEQAKYVQKGSYTNGLAPDETQKTGRLIRVCAACQDKHTLGNGRI